MKHSSLRTIYFPLAVFFLGLLIAIIAIQFPFTKNFITGLGKSGFPGIFFSGLFYSFGLTSSLATAIFFNVAENFSPWSVALVGGLGATLYDLLIFIFVRDQSRGGSLKFFKKYLKTRRKMPTWLSLLIGLAILGSPLPDELAASFFGFINFSERKFILISFLANSVGILIISFCR